MKRIGIDIDGTLTTLDAMVNVFNRETNKKLSVNDITQYDIGTCYGLSLEESKEVWNKHEREIYTRSLPIWNLHEFIKYWRQYGQMGKKENEIFIVTARDKKYEEVTKSWLKFNHVDYDDIYLGYEHKVDAVRQHLLDVFVDDKVENIRDIDNSPYLECRAYLVDKPYNREYKTQNRVIVKDNYDQVLNLV